MTIKVDIISKEMIKPSSPTPQHLRNHKLSFMDQMIITMYVTIALFYPATDTNKFHSISEKLKKSLSQTLVRFYPLAGRMDGNHSIDCNDEGAVFVEARAGINLSEILKNPKTDEVQQMMPLKPYEYRFGKEAEITAVQLNLLECGGICIGVCVSHHVVDARTLATFLNSWAATSRGSMEYMSPRFDSSVLFPTRDFTLEFDDATSKSVLFPTRDMISNMLEMIVAKKFEFNAASLSRLRTKLASVKPSRIEALTSLLLKTALKVKTKFGNYRPFISIHPVNIRTRMVPPLPETAFGNLWQFSVVPLGKEENDAEMHELASLIRESVMKIDGDYVKGLLGYDGFEKIRDNLQLLYNMIDNKTDCEALCFSSWVRFPFYETDFGWGKPTWMCTTMAQLKNTVMLTGTRCDDGIEAWVGLPEHEMIEFEQDEELLQFISSNSVNNL